MKDKSRTFFGFRGTRLEYLPTHPHGLFIKYNRETLLNMKKSTATALKLILAAYWSCFLIRSDSYYMPYLAV